MTLSEYLKIKEIKPAAFARDLGISPGHMHDIMHGRSHPRPPLAYRISKATKGKVKLETILGLN